MTDPIQDATLDYFEATAWSGIRELSRSGQEAAWDWEQPQLEKEILHLRRAAALAATKQMPTVRACQIFTNLGNAFDTVGRFVEAVRYWESALSLDPDFSMARGNLGIGFAIYADALWEGHDRRAFFERAHAELSSVGQDTEPNAGIVFVELRRKVEAILKSKVEPRHPLPNEAPGRSSQERQYRRWCLSERLFLNPQNDLAASQPAACDTLTLHSIVVPIWDGPYYHGFFNQLKQEYVSARWLLYDGMTSHGSHFSDRRVTLSNTLDYPAYGIGVEKVKLAYRAAYSLFDKMAYFLNHYFHLGIPERGVRFRTVWYTGGHRRERLSAPFQACRNLSLRGLFWLSKDLSEDSPGVREGIEPAAATLREIRNHLEHKYLKVHEIWLRKPEDDSVSAADGLTDTLAHSVGRGEFEAMAMMMFRLVRASLIYLSLAVASEEHRRAREREPGAIVPAMALGSYEDAWKT
ncbi:MAG: LA2681 family HEPN domain-containing protein [Dehalococcoidia bacterium]|nr:LA2681 family HEPN domain-containing protein [Dehalococcoidia bacterium]